MTDMLKTLDNVDEKKTKQVGKKLLGNYQNLKLIAGKDFVPKITADYSLEPVVTSFSSETPLEKHVMKKEDSIQELVEIANAINQVEKESKIILIKKYVEDEELNYVIWNQLCINESTFYRLLNKGLYQFALAFKSGAEIVYKSK